MTISSRDRAKLRSLAHHLKPVLHVGKEGITDAAVHALEEVFNTRELIKVKVQEAAPLTARDAGPIFEERIPGAHHVQTIGRTVVLYRRHPDKPEIGI